MTRRRGKPAPKPGPNPYAELPDDELDAEYNRMFSDYVERMESFEAMAGTFGDLRGRLRELREDPSRFDMTRGEADEYIWDRAVHMARGYELGQAAVERSRRLRESEHAHVGRMSAGDARAACGAAREAVPVYRDRMEGEPLRDYLMFVESWHDARAVMHGASAGMFDAWERELARSAELLTEVPPAWKTPR